MGNIVTVDFHNDTLFAVARDDGEFVAVKPISDSLGLAWNKQLERIKRDPILAEGMTVMVMPSLGGPQETTLLKVDLVSGWLFGIDESRVKDEETRQKVLTYKRECFSVLHRHFHRGAAEKPERIVIEDHEQTHESDNLKMRKITEARQIFGPRAAGQLWVYFGLEMVPAMVEENRSLTLFEYDRLKTTEADPAKNSEAA